MKLFINYMDRNSKPGRLQKIKKGFKPFLFLYFYLYLFVFVFIEYRFNIAHASNS